MKYDIDIEINILKKMLASWLQQMGHEPSSFNIDMLISTVQFRNGIIREEFKKARQQGAKVNELIFVLSDLFGVAEATVKAVAKDHR